MRNGTPGAVTCACGFALVPGRLPEGPGHIRFLEMNVFTRRPVESLAGALLTPSAIVGYILLAVWLLS